MRTVELAPNHAEWSRARAQRFRGSNQVRRLMSAPSGADFRSPALRRGRSRTVSPTARAGAEIGKQDRASRRFGGRLHSYRGSIPESRQMSEANGGCESHGTRAVPPGLPHEPHRRAIHRLAPACLEETIIHVAWIVLQKEFRFGSGGRALWRDCARNAERDRKGYALSRLRARARRSSSQSGLKRTSAPSPRSSRETASSRK